MLNEFLSFLENSPTTYHAAKECSTILAHHDFEPLDEKKRWKLEKAGSYFTLRDDAALICFSLPKKKPKKAVVLASHLDSPALKLKPSLHSTSKEHFRLSTEVYGGPLFSSWLNTPLGLAGKIYTDKGAKIINVTEVPAIIPQLAIHLDKEVNKKGLVLNPQEHLQPLLSLKPHDFLDFLKKRFSFSALHAYDLFFYPLQKPEYIGKSSEMIASYRLDNLTSAYASLYAMVKAKKRDDVLTISVFWDHEEVGSKTQSGAQSPFLHDTLKRIAAFYQMDEEDYFTMKNSSSLISIDVIHAYHPNYPEKHDPNLTPLLGKGPSIKYNAQQKYTSSSYLASKLIKMAKKEKIPLQDFVGRSDMSTGSTVGPPMASIMGTHTLDIGLPMLAMHSTREIVSTYDQKMLCYLLESALEHF